MEHRMRTPLDREKVRGLEVGDIIYLSGRLWTARDEAHKIILSEGLPKDMDIRDGAIYHCGPLVKKDGGQHVLLSAGPTTSMRMERYAPELVRRFGVSLVIGKGGMGEETRKALAETGAAYASFLGGGGALGAEKLVVEDVLFLDRLGMAEAVWVLEAKDFGPLVVAMDSKGNCIYDEVKTGALKNMEGLLQKAGQ
ncbi:MAG: FumA C-terminus/TtdB family hydratase beta subunit [Candidatus Thermoplasmatota archaeon]|nr:FumA C-terminus/TtdB family hydratase beta subunit [Candidatus Thermoplasmatota archaeon]